MMCDSVKLCLQPSGYPIAERTALNLGRLAHLLRKAGGKFDGENHLGLGNGLGLGLPSSGLEITRRLSGRDAKLGGESGDNFGGRAILLQKLKGLIHALRKLCRGRSTQDVSYILPLMSSVNS